MKKRGHDSLEQSLNLGLPLSRVHYLVLGLVIIAAVLIAQHGDVSGALIYQDYQYGYSGGYSGYGGFGGFQFGEIYSRYGYLIDAALFLLIFLGVGKGIFQEHFKSGGTAVYTGIGLFLAFALLLWEERTGVFLLERFGGFVVLLFVLVLVVWGYHWLEHAGLGVVGSLAVIYLVLYFTFTSLEPTLGNTVIFSRLSAISMWLYIAALIAGVVLIGAFIFRFSRKRPWHPYYDPRSRMP